jgi:hypothetical protein
VSGTFRFWSALRLFGRSCADLISTLGLGGRGAEISVGGITIRIPPEYPGSSWETFEPESVKRFSQWVERNPGALIIDIGCSLGIYSALALSIDSTAKVAAIDGDLASVAATRRLCQHTKGRDLVLVHGLVTNKAPPSSLDEASQKTDQEISAVSGDVGTTQYICLTSSKAR